MPVDKHYAPSQAAAQAAAGGDCEPTEKCTPTSKRIVELDGLRGLAILLVLWHHLVENNLPPGSSSWLGWLRAASCLSWSGVDLFFVLSGYFIGGILIDQRDSPRLARAFYLRRATRILPLYYVSLLVYLGIGALGASGSDPFFSPWVYVFFLPNIASAWANQWGSPLFSPLWSIAVEEQFYLVAPWIVRWFSPSRLPALLLALVGIAWFLRAGLYYFYPEKHVAIHMLMPMRMDTLALGGLVAWAARTKTSAPFFQRLTQTWPIWLGLCALAYVLLTICFYLRLSQINAYGGFSLLAIIYAFVVAVIAVVRPALPVRLFSSRLFVTLGRYSYFVYLWHMVIGWGLIKFLGGTQFVLNSAGSVAIVLLAVGATVFVGALSWQFFESPILKLGHRVSY